MPGGCADSDKLRALRLTFPLLFAVLTGCWTTVQRAVESMVSPFLASLGGSGTPGWYSLTCGPRQVARRRAETDRLGLDMAASVFHGYWFCCTD